MNSKTEQHDDASQIEDVVQYLTFKLDGESFATEISKVREVLEYTQVTPVPRSPEFMQGVINLRGNVVPVVDLRLQFGMPTIEPTVDSCIIIIEVTIEGTSTVLGALADSVQEVINLRPEQLESAPSFGARIDNAFVQYMGKLKDRFVIVLDMNKVFSLEQINKVEQNRTLDNDIEAA
ncbi:Positive regulator of CheA protein activity (CheW) [hydrothermal vent metagenome]|uniref:Positive regulator of CheA protein activity (CheW) n=1 Tax=hydrothermal vent metagenome TaxID=652676 RepID=A0A3B0W5N3_9ZZZZ